MELRLKEKYNREIELLLRKAGEAVMNVYESSNYGETRKLDFSPVTRADHTSSRIINEGLTRLFPEIPVVDEENPIPLYSERKFWKEYFLLDPLDGTKEFIKKKRRILHKPCPDEIRSASVFMDLQTGRGCWLDLS